MLFSEFADYVNGISGERPSAQRLGQWAFNLLLECQPVIADRIRGTHYDPFSTDTRLPRFLGRVLEFVLMDEVPDPEKKIKVVIDRSKWRTGGILLNAPSANEKPLDEFATGIGETRLLNTEGFMCCLGFVCEKTGVHPAQLVDIGDPAQLEINEEVAELTVWSSRNGQDCLVNTLFTGEAIAINDREGTSPASKEADLIKLFADSQYELEFVGEYAIPGSST